MLFVAVTAMPVCAADGTRVKELTKQRAGDATYFHVKLEPPADLEMPALRAWMLEKPTEPVRRQLASLRRNCRGCGDRMAFLFGLDRRHGKKPRPFAGLKGDFGWTMSGALTGGCCLQVDFDGNTPILCRRMPGATFPASGARPVGRRAPVTDGHAFRPWPCQRYAAGVALLRLPPAGSSIVTSVECRTCCVTHHALFRPLANSTLASFRPTLANSRLATMHDLAAIESR